MGLQRCSHGSSGYYSSRPVGRMGNPLVEALAPPQIAPLAGWQITQHNATHAHTLEADHLESDLFAHPAYLALLAFTNDEPQLILVLPDDCCFTQRLAI